MDHTTKIENDEFLAEKESFSVVSTSDASVPTRLTSIKDSDIKIISKYTQTLWVGNPNGKEGINIYDVINNGVRIFSQKKLNDNLYFIRHSASDFREVVYKLNLPADLKKCYPFIDTEDINFKNTVVLIMLIVDYYSQLVHFLYNESFTKYQEIFDFISENRLSYKLSKELHKENYKTHSFEKIFEEVSIIYLYSLFSVYKDNIINKRT